MLKKKLKIVETSLSALHGEMEQCQRQKQMQLNEIQSVIAFKPSQIEISSTDVNCIKDRDVVVIRRDKLEALEERPKVRVLFNDLCEKTNAFRS